VYECTKNATTQQQEENKFPKQINKKPGKTMSKSTTNKHSATGSKKTPQDCIGKIALARLHWQECNDKSATTRVHWQECIDKGCIT
jgi:hypothetical protein